VYICSGLKALSNAKLLPAAITLELNHPIVS